MLAEGAVQQLAYLGDQVVEVQYARLYDVAAGEGEQSAGEPGGPLGSGLDVQEIVADGLPLHLRGVVLGFLAGERRVVRDDREEVVEVVGHAPGELAEAFHPLGLVQLRFQPHPFRLVPEPFRLGLCFDPVGDVPDGGSYEDFLAGGDGGQGDFRREGAAVAAAPGRLQPGAHRPGPGVGGIPRPVPGVECPGVIGNQHLDGSADQLVAAVPEQVHYLRVHQRDPAVGLDAHHGVGRCFQQSCESGVVSRRHALHTLHS